MPIIAAFIVILAVLVYGSYLIYNVVAASFGSAMGMGAVVLCAVIIIAIVVIAVQRYYRLHGKTVDKNRLLTASLQNGSIQLDPNSKSGLIKRNAETDISFIFADIQQVQAQGDSTVLLQLRGYSDPTALAFSQNAEAALWIKRLGMAAKQTL